MIGTHNAILAPNIDTQLSKIKAIRDRSTFVAHPLYLMVEFRANGSHTNKTTDHPRDRSQDRGRLLTLHIALLNDIRLR